MDTVTTVADARAGLSAILRNFRQDPTTPPVTIGSHRRPEAVIIPVDQFRALAESPARRIPVLDELRTRSALISRLARLNKVTDVAVFGSVARGSERAESDIDLLVTPLDDASLFDLAQFEMDMSELTGREIQVVSRRGLDPQRDSQILAEAVPL